MLHFRVSIFLRQSELIEEFAFDSASHALSGHALGVRAEPVENLVSLLLQAVARSALSTGFVAAKDFLRSIEGESLSYTR